MIVVDASAMVQALIGRDVDATLLDALAGELAPHLVDVEVMSALRGLHLGGKIDRAVAERAQRDHFAFHHLLPRRRATGPSHLAVAPPVHHA